jgi:hypothetical protein
MHLLIGNHLPPRKASEICVKGRQKRRAETTGLLCCWAVRELGYRLTDLARILGMTEPGVGYPMGRGDRIAEERSLTLED